MKGVVAHGLLALLGLLFAYQTWTREAETDEDQGSQVTIAECAADGVQQLSLESPTHRILVEPSTQKAGTTYWITTRRRPESEIAAGKDKHKDASKDASKDKDAKETPEPSSAELADAQAAAKSAEPGRVDPTLPKRFLANAAFGEYLERLTPVRALRALGQLPKEKLGDFGFNDVGTRIALRCAGKQLDLEVGARTYGTGQRYVRDASTKAVYLVEETFVSDLQSAQFKFMQSDLHAFELDEVDAATLSARGAKKQLLHRDRKLQSQALWVDASAPQKRNELYGNWFSRMARLRVRDFLAEGAEPGSDVASPAGGKVVPGEITPVLTIEYAVEGKPKGKLELVRVDAGEQSRYYARSETTKVWVTLFDSSAKDVEQDLGLVVGVDEPKAAPAAAAPAVLAPSAAPAAGH